MPSALLRFLVKAIAVAAAVSPRCDAGDGPVLPDGDTTAQLQLKERRRSDSVLQSKLQSRLTAFENSLYWQGYGSESLASYFIGFLGHDTVQVGGLNITAKVGLNLMGNVLSGNFYQSVEADAAVLGLLPGCFTGGCNPAYYDDLLSTMAREGKIRRAFTLCFDDSPRGGGKLFLGRPEIPTDAVKIPLHPLTDGLRPYSPLSTFGPSGAGVEFFFGSKRVASRSSEEWNRLIRSGAGYSDTGTPGLVLPSSVLDEVLTELRRKLLADEMCASMWGPYLPKLTAQHLDSLTVSSTAASCALRHVEDFVVQLGPDISLNISKSSFFYETPVCSKQLKVSWTSAGHAEIFIFGTALNWGRTWLYDTSDLEAPKLILLGNADGCSANWAELATQSAPGQLLGLELPVSSPIDLQGVPAQVLGRDGTMTASVMIGSPPQEMTMQLDTGSQKLVGVHENCRNLGFCFLVQPENVTNTALLPGPEYGTEKCQRQVQVLTEVLSTTLSCSHLKSKLLCECTSQEECLRQILSAASQVQPSESCARDRRTCGEKMDFHPDASESFRPSMASSRASSRAAEAAGSAGPARSFLGSKRMEQCQRYRYCSDALGTARAPEPPESMARLAPEIGHKTDRSADRADRPVERATGSKPKEAAEDAWHTDATWKIPKQLPDRSQKETGEIERQSSKEQKHRWEEVLKESPPVPPVPRDTFGEIDRTTGSKQPKDAWHTDATWKSPKQLPESSQTNHRWEEVLKESPPVPPVPRDTFGELDRTTVSKQPKETVEDAWHTDATWKSPKQLPDSSEKETGEIERQSSKEQKHRWEEVLKESPPVPPVPRDTFGEIERTTGSKQPKDASPTDASPLGTWKTPKQLPDSSEKETGEIQRQSSNEQKHCWEEVMKESPPVPPVPRDTFGEIDRATGSKQPKETVEDASPTDANIGTWKSLKQLPDSSEKETAEIQRQSSREKHPWEEVMKESPPVLPVLRDAFGEIDRATGSKQPKETVEEIGQKTSSADRADGADRPLERATASTQPKETLEEKLKQPDVTSASPISLAPVSDFMDGLPPQPVIGEPQKLRGK